MLVIVSGYASVGKTTIAKKIANKMNAAFINGPQTVERLMEEIIIAKQLDGDDFQTTMKKRLETDRAVAALRQMVLDFDEVGLDTVLELSTYYSDAHIVERHEMAIKHVEITMDVALERAQLAAHNPALYASIDFDAHVATRFPVYSDGELFEQNVVISYDNGLPLTEARIEALVKNIRSE